MKPSQRPVTKLYEPGKSLLLLTIATDPAARVTLAEHTRDRLYWQVDSPTLTGIITTYHHSPNADAMRGLATVKRGPPGRTPPRR